MHCMIQYQLQDQLQGLVRLLQQLTDEQYTRKIRHLGQATIGGHSRHIIEIVQCVLSGYETGRVDYIHRYRNTELEMNRSAAIQLIQEVERMLNKTDRSLELFMETATGVLQNSLLTTYLREIIYSIEHTVHHLALIKVALTEMELSLADETFGIAYSTMLYRKSIAKG